MIFKPTENLLAAKLILAAASILVPSGALAHDVWLTVGRYGTELRAQVNNGDTEEREMPDRDRVVTLDLVTATQRVDLRKPLASSQRHGAPVLETKRFPARSGLMLSITYDSGFWLKSPTDKSDINSTRLLVPGGTSEHWTVKYGKMLLGPGAFSRVAHSRLEIIPLKDPFKLPRGQQLPVRLELNGRPVAGVKVAYGDGVTPTPDERMPFVRTDQDGVAEIPLTRTGAYLLTADCDAPPLRSELVQFDHLYASLTFDTSKQVLVSRH